MSRYQTHARIHLSKEEPVVQCYENVVFLGRFGTSLQDGLGTFAHTQRALPDFLGHEIGSHS